MDKKLPVYKITKPKEGLGGVFEVAFVDEPAIMTDFLMFENKQKFAVEKERQLITTPVLIADLPIYRRDNVKGEFYVVFDVDSVRDLQYEFMKTNRLHKVNEMHDSDKPINGVFMVNSFLSDIQMGIEPPKAFSDLPYGTWYATYHISNKDVWDNFIKTGMFKGVSVEGVFDLIDEKSELEINILATINEILNEQ